MRVTNALFYQNAKNQYQTSLSSLYNINAQIASGMKIQNSYEDSSVYTNTMRLNYEVATLEQVTETTSKAQTFANNTDSTLNEFTDTLTEFRTKVLQASSAASSDTSREAIANELEALKEHLITLGNTSINGQYLFSGTAFSTKPLSDDGTYNGNDQNINALVGSNVELSYNITGQDLFLGNDTDYHRIVSTNVSLYNQTLLYPEQMGGDEDAQEVYLSESDTIRDMVGDIDDTTGSPITSFYVSGRNTMGTTFSKEIQLDSDANVSDLLESIGKLYGNTSTNDVVDVYMNDYGQIEIKDLNSGSSLLEFNMFAAVDRNAADGTVGNASQTDIDDLLSYSNVDIIEFSRSNYLSENTASTISSSQDIYNPGLFKVGAPMSLSDGSSVDGDTTLASLGISEIVLSGSDNDGTAVTATTLAVPADIVDVYDLLAELETLYPNMSARIEDGQIYLEGGDSTDYSLNLLDVQITANDSSSNPVNAFTTFDSMNYQRRGFEKDGNELVGNISQIVKDTNEFATSSTKLVDVAGSNTLDGKQLLLNGVDKDGNSFNVQLDLATTGSTFSLDGGITNYDIFDGDGVATPADEMTYQQLMNVISMITADILPSDTDTSGTIDASEYNDAIKTAQNSVEVNLDYRGRLEIIDTTKSVSNIEFSMYDSNADTVGTGSVLSFMANDAVVVEDQYIDFFSDLDDIIEAVRNGSSGMDADGDDPRNIGLENAIQRLDHISDHVTKQHAVIGAYSNALSSANERAQLLSVNVQTVRSEVIDVDIAEAYLTYEQLSTSYQAALSTISKINSLSLLNYM
jgi:flagellar hook-associated protein 3 FlgL